MIDNYKTHGEQKIQLTIKINFISSLNTGELFPIYLKSDNAKFVMGFETDDIINKLFESSLKKYQEGLERKMRRSYFCF